MQCSAVIMQWSAVLHTAIALICERMSGDVLRLRTYLMLYMMLASLTQFTSRREQDCLRCFEKAT